MTEPTTELVYLHPVTSSIPTKEEHKDACYAFLQRLVHHGLLAFDVRWSGGQDRWVLMFGAKGMLPV